jgi:Transposase DDE domain/Transposase domain (DUF772)
MFVLPTNNKAEVAAMSLMAKVSPLWNRFQQNLFPALEDAVGSLTALHEKLIIVLDVACIEAFVRSFYGLPGRPPAERRALARAFVAKSVLNLPTTVTLIDRLKVDQPLRRLCGWERVAAIPSESTFSRAFAEFAATNLPGKIHEALIKDVFENRLVGHISRDGTAIEARERPAKAPDTVEPGRPPATGTPVPVAPLLEAIAPKPSAQAAAASPPAPAAAKPSSGSPAAKHKRGRPRKGEVRAPKEPRRIEKQAAGMSLKDMLADLPKACDVGTKLNAKGHKTSWIGYKLHIDTADGDIPVSCVLTSASLHDSQVAIPLATMTAARGIINCYDLMDSAYDVSHIKDHSRALGHVPIIDVNPRRNTALKDERNLEAKRLKLLRHARAEDIRYKERSAAERVNGQLKDSYGGETVRVRGHTKVACHLMFGILAITVLQIMRLAP